MMRMSADFGPCTAGIPYRSAGFADRHHVAHTVPQIRAHFDDGSPCRPDGRTLRQRQYVIKRRHIFPMKGLIEGFLHMLRVGRALGIDIEHEKAVVAVGKRDALDRFERIVEIVGRSRGGVDPDGDEGILTPGTEDITVFVIKIGNIEPARGIIGFLSLSRQTHSVGERENLEFPGRGGRNMSHKENSPPNL